jgi:hypothetical protein
MVGRKIMKFLHEMMPIFHTEFREFPLRGLGLTYKMGFNFRHLLLQNNSQRPRVIVKEFTGGESSRVTSRQRVRH